MANKKIFNANDTAKKFLSVITETDNDIKLKKNTKKQRSDYIPKGKEIGENRPKSTDRETGEVTQQIGYFVTTTQDRTLRELAAKMKTNKSAIVRKALAMYFDYLKSEEIL